MSKRTFITIVFLLISLPAKPGLAFDLTPGFSANNDVLEGRLLFGDPNGGNVGPFVQWNDRSPNHIWGIGGAATFDVTQGARGLLDNLLNPPNAWWTLLDSLGGQVYLLVKVGIVDVVDNPSAFASPGVGIGLGPFYFDQSYNLIETGGVPVMSSGYTWSLGIRKIIRF